MNSEAILDELFSSIAPQTESTDEDSGSEAELSENSRKSHKKGKKKKKKKEKKKKKKRKRENSAEPEVAEAPSDSLHKRKSRPLEASSSSSSFWKPGDDRLSSHHRGESNFSRDRNHDRDDRHHRSSSTATSSGRQPDHSRNNDRDRLFNDRDRHFNDRDRHTNDRDRHFKDHNKSRDNDFRSRDYSQRSKEDDHRNQSRRDDRRRPFDEGRNSRNYDDRRSNRSNIERPPVRHHHRPERRSRSRDRGGDVFWDSKWDAMQLQKKADDQERKGRHYLDDRRRSDEKKERDKKKEKRESKSPECEELKRLKKLKEIQDLVVKDSEKYVAEPLDPNLFEWDNYAKMWKKKSKTYEDELRERMDQQFKGTKSSDKSEKPETFDQELEQYKKDRDIKEEDIKKEKEDKPPKDRVENSGQLTLDEIEDIRRKREKNKNNESEEGEINDDEKEDGEVEDDDNKKKKKSSTRRRSRSRSRSHRRRRSRSRSRRRSPPRGSRYRSPSYRRRRSPYYDRYSSRRRSSRDRNSFRGSRSAIDKEKLLAIAKKNAVKLLSSDNLMGMDHDRLMAIKSGGQNLSQLTSFCRELARKGITDEFSDHGGSDSETEFHHPFMVKDRPLPNPMGFDNSAGVTSEVLTPAMKIAAKSHRMLEFPVSSGNAHRVKEVDPAVESPPHVPLALPAPTPAAEMEPPKPATPPPPAPPVETDAEKINKANPLGVIMFGGAKEPEPEPEEREASTPPPPPPPQPVPIPSTSFKPEMEEKKKVNVFTTADEPSKDIGSIVSQRLNAMRKLTENPNDTEAMKEMYEIQKDMSNWAASKNKPGQFTGHTGAKVLSKGELSTGIQAWAKQEQFTTAQKVSGGFGEFMLRKMGWSDGDGLGKDRSGDVDPLTLDIKMDKKGLMAAEEGVAKRKNKNSVLTLTGCKDLSGKHPISGLMELATRRRWGPPNFVQCFECGPSHRKQYIFKVTVNGMDYQPTVACDNKKKAKADAATYALQEMGLLPKDPNNPL